MAHQCTQLCIVCSPDIDECLPSPCHHGGTCSTPQINMFSCVCPTGVTGSTCETGIFTEACILCDVISVLL